MQAEKIGEITGYILIALLIIFISSKFLGKKKK
jgi:hypothetical protein